jgi:hypothetical protein
MRHVDPVIAGLAQRQHGDVARDQLLALGVSSDHVKARLRSGLLAVVHPGVYRLAGSDPTPDSRRMAAVLRCRAGAQLAGWTGASHHTLLPDAGARLDIAVPPERQIGSRAFSLTRTTPRASEQMLVRGVPTHTVARVLLDLARRDDGGKVLEWAWRQAIFHQLLDIREVRQVLADHHGRAGTPALRALHDRRATLIGELRNAFELRMLAIIREAGLPEPLCNVPLTVADGLVLKPDFRIPELMLVVEADGRDGHDDVEFLLTDDERDAYYAALGYRTLRYTYWQAKREQGRLDAELREHREAYLRDHP